MVGWIKFDSTNQEVTKYKWTDLVLILRSVIPPAWLLIYPW